MAWSLYEKGEQGEKFLNPLKFSNGKTQEDVVQEVIREIDSGSKVIFIHGVCGTGKSAIALNLGKEVGRTSVVVPGKNLQAQYLKDYGDDENKFLLKENKEKLKISVITGRNNHKCKFLEQNQVVIPKVKKETNANLHDIFEGKHEELEEKKQRDMSAANRDLPCKIELKEKNISKVKKYIQKNRHNVNPNNFLVIQDVSRPAVASLCPYWSPVIPAVHEMGGKIFSGAQKRTYEGLKGETYTFYYRRPGCPFYEQFNSYLDADVLVFNSMKYKLESALNRKPRTEVEIIDECDEFLDSFSNQSNINIDRLQLSLMNVFTGEDFAQKIVEELQMIIKQIKKSEEVAEAVESGEILELKKTGIYDLLRILYNSPEFLEEVDEESYIFEVEETARMFADFWSESYVTFTKRDNQLVASVVTTNLAKKFQEMIEKNKIIVLMSGTLHSEHVLKNIFGLEDYKIIDAEVEQQGQIEVVKTGLEMDCKYSNFSNGKCSREDYLKALDKCVDVSKKPSLVHVNAFSDLPTGKEIEELELNNLISREKLRELQSGSGSGKMIQRFKEGKINVLFSTRSSRGMDFPGEQCNSIIFTKYPNPNVKDAFWNILNKTRPQDYWDFYRDKARRELLQKIYRGLRFNEDHIFLLSPDERVLDSFKSDKKY